MKHRMIGSESLVSDLVVHSAKMAARDMKHYRHSCRSLIVPITMIIAFVVVLACSFDARAQSFSQWGKLTPGPYAVGFKVVNTHDYSRTYESKAEPGGTPKNGDRARPIQISIWFPAKQSARALHMRYEEYIYTMAASGKSGPPSASEKEAARTRFMAAPLSNGADQAKLDGLMKTQTAVVKGVLPAQGHFPLIVFGQGIGFESPISHSIICEFLASNGYVVAACPCLGFDSPRAGNNLASLETEVRDMEFVIGYMRSFGSVDRRKLGLVGFDLGGMSALLLQMRNTNVDAICSTGSGITFQHNTAVLKRSGFYNGSRLTVPLMQMSIPKSQTERFGMQEDNSIFELPSHADMYYLRFNGMDHPSYTSLGMITEQVPKFIHTEATADVKLCYGLICRYALAFLNVYVKGDRAALADLRTDPRSAGVPDGVLTVEFKPAEGVHPTER